MADETKNITISKTNSGFPGYLDFDKLRSEGIDYLGRLTGKIWTDYNVHDPGITILEVLCYALLDLGYRTNLPAADIFARNPKDPSAENNFFTPAQILACNPLTIIDFIKLLIDIEGVKNAWLEIATDQIDFCHQRPQPEPQPQPPPGAVLLSSRLPQNTEEGCIDYLNGLYHVYLELEPDLEKQFESDPEKKTVFITGIKEALMAHRNLCEDFIDVYILCKQKLGVCADIDLEENADAEQVYISVVEKLKDFLSPFPQFYTLQQLLDKDKSIDEIFVGRPYNLTTSHGFTDTEELKQLKLRKEIHLSDVYHTIFDIPGVEGVNGLKLQACDINGIAPIDGWKYQLPVNHVAEFSWECSGFRFTKKGRPAFVDFKKFEGLLTISFSQNGKIAYQMPSPYLDTTIPQGTYHSDLADYYSVQNEFPRVYGIAEGGLSESASAERQAQAYQLKAWLLFFDQLLANYLAQLKNIRNLFSFSSPAANENHTYFNGQLTSVPDHQKLVRFNVEEENENMLGTQGSILVFPVERKKLTALADQGKLNTLSIDEIAPYTFNTLADQDMIIDQLKNDLYFQQYHLEYVTKTNECVFYYFLTSSDEIALVCKKYFKNKTEAKQHADNVPYIGAFDENYNSFINADNSFSFNIRLNLISFSNYLQLILENESLFEDRRQGFLNHLLSRFAEQFTDYALLSFGFQDPHQSQLSEIRQKENYLTNYADLSSNRGRAYNYLENKWNNQNISGFEKKVKAIGGMDDPERRSLCNFIVAKYDEQFAVTLRMAGTSLFSAEERSDSIEEGLAAAHSIFLAMKETKNYQATYIVHDKQYQLEVAYNNQKIAVFPQTFNTEMAAMETAKRLSGLFVKADAESTVFASSFIYIPQLKDSTGKVVRRSVPSYESEADATSATLKTIKKINDRKFWNYDEGGEALGSLIHISFIEDHLSFININAFKIDIDNSVIDKPDVFTYELLDRENYFKFVSSNEFQSEDDAGNDAQLLLTFLTDEFSYEIFENTEGRFQIRIRNQEKVIAVSARESNSEEDALRLKYRILDIVFKHRYDIAIDKLANRWKFNYELGYESDNLHQFKSIDDYEEKTNAVQAAASFIEIEPDLQLKDGKDGFTLTARNKKTKPITVRWVSTEGDAPPTPGEKESVKKLLEEKKELVRLDNNNTARDFQASVQLDDKSREGLYVYRLVDKDAIPAFFSQKFNSADEAKTAIKELSNTFKYPKGYLKICMGGAHVVHKITDEDTKKYWYHYQIKSVNHYYTTGIETGKTMVLFESIHGYASEEDAEQAFKENYLDIIHLSSDIDNYGEDKKISLEEILIHDSPSWKKNESVVFVPKATRDELGGDAAGVINKLAGISRTYPIRMVSSGSKEFFELFPCENGKPEDIDPCKKDEEKLVYYFILNSGNDACWQSTKHFESVEEATQVFSFFLMLLYYPGNYFVDCDTCAKDRTNTFHIYIREVLAEGTERFPTEAAAWSNEGVQKFICIAQSDDAFHTYLRKKDCCYSFYVSCKNSLVYHPCKYDTPQRRDTALLQLYQSLKEAINKQSWQTENTGNGLLLLNEAGDHFAEVVRISDNYCTSDIIAVLSENVGNKDHFQEREGRFILIDDSNNQLAISTTDGLKLEEWIALFKTFLCMYPVVKTRSEGLRNDQYCIEIKLPGFNTCKEDTAEEGPCGCGKKTEEENPECFIAWESRCCYDNCWEAEQALPTFLRLLQQYEFYQPVFDCECNSFGITLQFEKISIITNPDITYYDSEANIVNWHNSEILAINPQCYPSKEAACDAVNRAKKLTNMEGLHVVEHILLRPHCPEDCDCRQYGRWCDETGCEFEWEVPDDPCSLEKNICFVPGTDPYSFIATIALPAWPERFRKKENRDLLEDIIYREAPAHILIRILWLAPHDFCCFETKYKKWNRWLAQKKTCIGDFSVCDFMEFLFRRNYECLSDCNVCALCSDEPGEQQPCFAEIRDADNEKEYLNQINKVYCWQDQHCYEYQYTGCDEGPREPGNNNPDGPVILRERAPQPQPGSAESTTNRRSKPQAVNSRLMHYRKRVESVVSNSRNPIASKAQSFIADPLPDFERLSKLVTEILQNKPPKSNQLKSLTGKQKEDLLKNVICYWLDRHCFNGKDIDEINQVHEVFKRIEKAKIKPGEIFNYWDFSEVKHYEPELDEAVFRKIFNIN